MTCREVLDFLMAYLDGEVDAMTKVEFEHHLSVCRCCRAYLQNYAEVVRMGREAYAEPEADHIPEQLIDAILKSTTRQGQPGPQTT